MKEMDERTERENAPRVIHLPVRQRWGWKRWVVPLCVVTSVSLGFVIRLSIDDWRGIMPLLRKAKPLPERVAVRPLAQSERLDLVPAPPLIRPEARALRPARDGAPSFVGRRPTLEPILPTSDHGDMASQLASREIDEESMRQQAEQARIAILRKHEQEIEQKRTRALRFHRIQNAIAEAETERSAFHAEVVAILDKHGSRAGEKLLDLLEKHDSDASPEVAAAVRIVMQRPSAPTISAKKIRLYRSLGMPEPAILDDLVRAEWKRIPARNGPKNAAEALVRAAKKLRAVPPGPRQAAARPTGQPGEGMPQ